MRKEETVVVPASGGRDAGKHFFITEFSADQQERWAVRALLAATASGVDIPEDTIALGMGAVLALGLRQLLTMSFAEAVPLLDEMMECVQIRPDPKKPDVMRRPDDDDIEELTTRLLLRNRIVELHTGFSIADSLSKLGKVAASSPSSNIADIPTSPE